MSRHKARQQALEILFSREFHGENDIQYEENEILHDDQADEASETELVYSDEDAYRDYLVTTVTAHAEELDGIIQSLAKGWDLSQMNRADKNIMRIALCELNYPLDQKLADSIVLNEAIVLAKEFSGQKSARFVNGILGHYVRQGNQAE